MLAVEVVSPTSPSMDQITRHALYAAAGIPHYWVVETDGGVVVHAYRLDSAAGMYRPAGTFDTEIATSEPWPITIPIKKLTPRHL